MLCRKAGDFQTSHRTNNQSFPVRLCRQRYYPVRVGMLFGLPSLRIKGVNLTAATQVFLARLFDRGAWFDNHSASGQVNASDRVGFGIQVTGAETAGGGQLSDFTCNPDRRALIARTLMRWMPRRQWMAIRHMPIAAEIIGVPPLQAKLTAFG